MKDIFAVLQKYFDLLYTCDVAGFDAVFHPNAQLQTVGANGYAMLTAQAYRDLLAKRASPASQNGERSDEVLAIDIGSEVSVLAKVRVLINGVVFQDYLSLLKVEGGWRIVAKVYVVRT